MELKDSFIGNHGVPYLQILHSEARFDLFLKWMKSLDFVVWVYIQSWIIRSPYVEGMFGNYIFNEYFEKRKLLATSVGLSVIAKTCGTSKSRAAKCVHSLVEKGFLEIEHLKRNGMTYNIYILGTHDGFHNELLFVRKHFIKSFSNECSSYTETDLLRKVEGDRCHSDTP